VSGAFDHLDNPYFQGFAKPVSEERDDRDLVVEGTLPAALEGMFVKNGPNPQFPPRGTYHPFDGDGMLHAVRIEGGRARYLNRWVRTPGFELERRHGRALFGGFADLAPPDPLALQEVGMVKHVANTNVIAHAGKLLALWEGGMPYAMGPTLDTLGLETFGGDYHGPFTAHPCKDAETGELFAFGYAPFPPFLTLLAVDAAGKLLHRAPIALPRPVMIHDFCITKQYAVVLDAPHCSTCAPR
jgi:carotenoid cleavage dioxygenase